MPKKDPTKCCCDDALAVIQLAQQHLPIRLQHASCTTGKHKKAIPVPSSRINEYNLYITTCPVPTLIPKEKGYLLCPGMKSMVDRGLKKRDRDEAAAATNNNTNAASNPGTRPDPPGVVGGIMLPGTVTGAATVPKQEAAAGEIAAENDRITVHNYLN